MNTTKASAMLAALLLFIFAVVEVLSLTSTSVVAQAEAATATPVANLGVTQFATHPQASKLGFNYTSTNYYSGARLCGPDKSGAKITDWDNDGFCDVGQSLGDIAVSKNGELVAGYGEWNINVDSFAAPGGRVAVVPLNVKTGSWGATTHAGSEAIEVIRKLPNGDIAAPTTDPSDRAAAGMPHGGIPGIVTNRGGSWHFARDTNPAVHIFDVQQESSGALWIFGSAADPKPHALARRSTDGGASWSTARKEYSAGSPTGFERFYWGAALGNTVYTSGARVAAGGGDGPVLMHANGSWSTLSAKEDTRRASWVESFGGTKVRLGTSGVLWTVGNGTVLKPTPDKIPPRDSYVGDDGYFYVYTSDRVFRTNKPAGEWETVGKVEPAVAWLIKSLAVHDDRLYFGGAKGVVYRAEMSVTDAVRTSAGLGVEKEIGDASKLLAAERTRTDALAKAEQERADTQLSQQILAADAREKQELLRFDDTLANRETARAIILVNRAGVTVSRMDYERDRLLRIWNAERSRALRIVSANLSTERQRAESELSRSKSMEDAEKTHAATVPSISTAVIERAAADRLVRDTRIKKDSAELLERIQADGDAMEQRIEAQRGYAVTAKQEAKRATYIDNREAKGFARLRAREEQRASILASRGISSTRRAQERARMVRIVTSQIARSGGIAAKEVDRSQGLAKTATDQSASLAALDNSLASKVSDVGRKMRMSDRVMRDQQIRNERIAVDRRERDKRIQDSQAKRDASLNGLLALTPG